MEYIMSGSNSFLPTYTWEVKKDFIFAGIKPSLLAWQANILSNMPTEASLVDMDLLFDWP